MDAGDLILLGAKGVLVAMVPLALVWSARGSDKLLRLAWVTVFFTFDLIVFGAFTRLTDSGLGCPDWPGCYARANPIAALSEIRAAEAAMPDGPVTLFKAWIEMLHRYLAMGVGLLILVMMVLAWRNYWRGQQAAKPWLASALFVLVCVQGAFGAWTVTQKLQPVIVTIHLLLGMALLALLTWQAMRLAPGRVGAAYVPGLRGLAAWAGLVLVMQIALGGWVSTNYAVLACNDFPLCQGELMPAMDFANGFHLWRELGRSADNSFLPYPALTAIHWVHRNFAWLVLAIVGALAWRAARSPALRGLARWLAALLIAQVLTGVANVVFDWPLVAAVLHNAGAAAMVMVLVMLNYRFARLAPILLRQP